MSYRCEFCRRHQPAGTPCKKVVISKRMHDHPFRSKVGWHWEFNEKKQKWMWVLYDDPGGSGMQIAAEVKSCPECAMEYGRDEAKRQEYKTLVG
jgi:hypothetical protein